MDPQRYVTLFDSNFRVGFKPSKPLSAEEPALRKQTSNEDMLLTGILSRNGAMGSLDPILRVPSVGTPDLPSDRGAFCVQLVDGSSSTSYCFHEDFRDGPAAPFIFRVPADGRLNRR